MLGSHLCYACKYGSGGAASAKHVCRSQAALWRFQHVLFAARCPAG